MDFREIDWVDVLVKLGINKQYLKKREGPCPICGGKERFRFTNKKKCGDWFCNHCRGGNGFTLIKKYTGMADHDVLEEIRRISGLPKNYKWITNAYVVPDDLSEEEIAKNRDRLIRTWRDSKPLRQFNGPVEMYLEHRVPGSTLSRMSKHVRFHPSLKYFEMGDDDKLKSRGNHPAMICRVIDAAGKPITLHRTYLTPNGFKADLSKPKMQMGGVRKLKGAAVRIFENNDSRILGVCEGFENGWAVATAYRYKLTVWSLLNAYNLSIADIPRDRFDEVIIFSDFDKIDVSKKYRTGEHHAKLLAERLKKQGFKVSIKFPAREGIDFDDMWKEFHQSLGIKAA
jgi:putative DNA primase/helicase